MTGYCADGKPGAFAYAAINMPIDSDGFVRQAELFAWGKNPAESFPVFMAEEYLAQVDPHCANCILRPLNKHAAQFRGHPGDALFDINVPGGGQAGYALFDINVRGRGHLGSSSSHACNINCAATWLRAL